VPSIHAAMINSNPQVDKLFFQPGPRWTQKERPVLPRGGQPLIMRDLPGNSLTDTPKFAAFPKKVRRRKYAAFLGCVLRAQDAWLPNDACKGHYGLGPRFSSGVTGNEKLLRFIIHLRKGTGRGDKK